LWEVLIPTVRGVGGGRVNHERGLTTATIPLTSGSSNESDDRNGERHDDGGPLGP
jgi:hypothetical protein